MKNLLWFGLLIGICGMLRATPSEAISIDFSPTTQSVNLGDTFAMDLIVSGLEAVTPAQIVSAYDLDVTYDAALFVATDVTFGTSLGFTLFQDWNLASGLVDLAEVSLEWDQDLAALQGDSVTLATLTFNAIGTGTGTFDFFFDTVNNVTGTDGQELSLTAKSGQVEVPAPVPEPGTLILLGSGLIGLVGYSWRRRTVTA